ncbi:MAG: DUF262 domain-containing protein [Salana multivorans]|uniref:DUF262 domain-containing protein n=1 Tax=Salana multivorans TaxID=120377 RepID=UPI0009620A48|nr:DUF262 domain-containing protein [Salana multivorans]MBN8882065.1 DUF262 domain-containing protein [Salana multivorans]OJX94791.1 MAG: hypothetical protein BGO96_01670 [Micrococcales bacterium 73-15]
MEQGSFEGLEDQLAAERYKVDVASVSFSVRELVRMYEDTELSIAPSYQRKYRWPVKVASTFIESVFLGLPIPPIFVATNDDFQWEVVDGLQRISTLILFLSESDHARKQIGRDNPLVLEGLENLTQLNNVGFASLPQAIQRYFARQPLQVISLTDKSDKAVRFDLFERLNTGAISLTAQEVRSAVYGGDFLSFIDELAQNKDLKKLLKLQESNQHDGTSSEQVLKFFAYKNDSEAFSGAVTTFLNNFTSKSQTGFNYAIERDLFEKTVRFLAELLDGPFLRNRTSVTPLVQFEACTVAIGTILSEGNSPTAPAVDWLNDAELVASSTGGTNTRSMLARRVNRAKALFSGAGN